MTYLSFKPPEYSFLLSAANSKFLSPNPIAKRPTTSEKPKLMVNSFGCPLDFFMQPTLHGLIAAFKAKGASRLSRTIE